MTAPVAATIRHHQQQMVLRVGLISEEPGTTSRRSFGMEGGATSSRCFFRFDCWDWEAEGLGYQHEEAWGMNRVTKYAGTAWDGWLRNRGDEGAGMGRAVPAPVCEWADVFVSLSLSLSVSLSLSSSLSLSASVVAICVVASLFCRHS